MNYLKKHMRKDLDSNPLPVRDGKMICDGCIENEQCQIQMWGSVATHECPCKECLVKMICSDPCNLLNDHYASIHNINKKE